MPRLPAGVGAEVGARLESNFSKTGAQFEHGVVAESVKLPAPGVGSGADVGLYVNGLNGPFGGPCLNGELGVVQPAYEGSREP